MIDDSCAILPLFACLRLFHYDITPEKATDADIIRIAGILKQMRREFEVENCMIFCYGLLLFPQKQATRFSKNHFAHSTDFKSQIFQWENGL